MEITDADFAPDAPVGERSMSGAPKDGSKIDLHLHIYASPRSMGWSDDFWVPHCWWQDGKWGHLYKGEFTELYDDYIVGWAPDGSQPTDYREV